MAAEPALAPEVFRYCFVHFFDITAAAKMLAAGELPHQMLELSDSDVRSLAERLLHPEVYRAPDGSWQSTPVNASLLAVPIDPLAALALPEAVLGEPGLLLQLPGRDGADPYCVLIDGHHRLFRAYAEGRGLNLRLVTDLAAIERFYSHSTRVDSLLAPRPQKARRRASSR